MVALYVILISTAAVLPSLISTVAVPVYLLEEIIRFAVKKKWKNCIFALISLFLLMAIAITFYYGSKHEWKGFVGLDNYVSEIFKTKNFITISGRTKIWETVLPLCFDSPLHAVLGHGFLLSRKSLIAITSVMYNNTVGGVQTTHNGYLEILFDYGLVGLIVHAVLIGYFVYCAIRLL